MKKLILAIVAIGLIGGGITAYLMYNKPHKDMQAAEAAYQMSAAELYSAFEEDESAANEQYLDQVVQVSGTIRKVSKDDTGGISLTLDSSSDMFGVVCELDPLTDFSESNFEEGQQIVLKGNCTGMLMDVVLVRCVPVS